MRALSFNEMLRLHRIQASHHAISLLAQHLQHFRYHFLACNRSAIISSHAPRQPAPDNRRSTPDATPNVSMPHFSFGRLIDLEPTGRRAHERAARLRPFRAQRRRRRGTGRRLWKPSRRQYFMTLRAASMTMILSARFPRRRCHRPA